MKNIRENDVADNKKYYESLHPESHGLLRKKRTR